MLTNNTQKPDARLAELLRESEKIQNWMKAHWNQDGTDAYREQRRRYMAIIDEINLLQSTQNTAL